MDYFIAFGAIAVSFMLLRISGTVQYFRWIDIFIYIKFLMRRQKKRLDLNVLDFQSKSRIEEFNFMAHPDEYTLESPFSDYHLKNAKDEVFFYGVNSRAEHIVVSISRLGDHRSEAYLHLKLASGRCFELQRRAGFERATSDRSIFSCDDLQIRYARPMRQWRLFYNGLLRETDENSGESRMTYVKFALKWRASSDVFDFSEDTHPKLLAKCLEKDSWQKIPTSLERLKRALNSYGQAGTIHGLINIDELPEYEIYLFGQRMRNLGHTSELKDMKMKHILGYVPKNGAFIHIGMLGSDKLFKNFTFGYLVHPSSALMTVRELHNFETRLLLTDAKHRFETKFVAEQIWTLKVSVESKLSKLKHGDNPFGSEINPVKFSLNGKNGFGFQILTINQPRLMEKNSTIPSFYVKPKVIPYAVTLLDKICQIPEVSGCKGASMSHLVKLSGEHQTFEVPNGFAVTTASFEHFLNDNIISEIKTLENVLYGKFPGDVKNSCKSVQQAILKSEFPEDVKKATIEGMSLCFGQEMNTVKVAVRSSAMGEDTDQMSAAGQMETFLGVSGVEQIIKSIKKCWASQFSFAAVQYKRFNGQCVNSRMAVLIQRLVQCDVAGVLFTCDPSTGNPTVLTVSANYGLGESVVSGCQEPDTVILNRDVENNLSIKNISVGKKTQKVVISDYGDGTTKEDTLPSKTNVCCITDEMAVRLGHLAIQIEKYYRSSVDLEWGFCENKIHIFQCRPVTSGIAETQFEIEHEFDSALRLEDDFWSVSNTGEVISGSCSPLGIGSYLNMVPMVTNKERLKGDMPIAKYYSYGYTLWNSHPAFNISDIFKSYKGEDSDSMTKAGVIGFFGRMLDAPKLVEVTKERFGTNYKESLRFIIRSFTNLYYAERILRRLVRESNDAFIPVENYESATELFEAILLREKDMIESMTCHVKCTRSSMLWNMLLLSVLSRAHGECDDVVYNDLATLLKTNSDVESADIPSAIQRLTYQISQETDSETFKRSEPKEALKWLLTLNTPEGKIFEDFLKKHGHRCLNEYDIYMKTWEEDPLHLVKALQKSCGNVVPYKTEPKSDDLNEVISKLNVPLSYLTRLKVKFLIPRCRRNVQARECSKSLVVKKLYGIRKGYRRLSKLMVAEGRIPDEDLLYFLTLEDIRELLENRSPSILSRAVHRRKLFPLMDTYVFPQIMRGIPRRVNEDVEIDPPADGSFSMKGVPVSQGVVRGIVRVAVCLEEADALQPGEILVTRWTDIGWSPYFPILSGVVTELGGLISHGAVVCREYGIPCIAGLHGVTRKVSSGDYVLLDGNKGILKKLKYDDQNT